MMSETRQGPRVHRAAATATWKHDRTQALVAEAAVVLEEIYDPAGVLIFWSSRIKYLDNHRPCDLYRDKDDAMLERLVQHLNALADGSFS